MKKMEFDNKNVCILEGIISVEAAVKAKKRKMIIVYADEAKYKSRDRKIVRFLSFLKSENVPYELHSRDKIDNLAGGNTHGGVIAYATEREFTDFVEFIASINNNEYCVFLDGVEDPFNFGYSIRNLFAFGCKGFILPERNWMSAASVVAKSSAGASELCELSIAPDDETALEIIKKHNVSIVCAGLGPTSVSLHNFNLNSPFILFIGGEKRGISKTFFENADYVVHIPYTNKDASYSLPTASCAAIFGSIISSKKQSCD